MKKFLFILVLVFTAAVFAGNKIYTGKVIWLHDGDSFILKSGGKRLEVRLWGVDAPEKSQAGGREALYFMIKLLKNKDVRVESLTKDPYGRIVAKVYLDDIFVNLKIIQSGHAWWYKRYAPEEKKFAQAEKEARKAGLGLWRESEPVNPETYRHRKK